ncbi:hypothetical protein V6Z11_D02G151400 [Gossypium hirsutum]
MFHFTKAIFFCFSCDSEASFFPSTYARSSQPSVRNPLPFINSLSPSPRH